MAVATEVVSAARGKISTVESPPNSNHQMFGVWYGFDRVPWCAIFVSWCMDQAGAASQYRNASVAFSLDTARKQGRRTGEFRTGFVACRINDGSDWGPGHTGIIEAVHNDDTVTSIEGNTSPGDGGSQRDGGGVWRRRRPKSYWNKQCIRIDYSGASQAPAPQTPPASTGTKCQDSAGHPLLKLGAKGKAVNHLQYFLIKSGAKISGDGDFGPATRQALINHQTWLRDTKDRTIVVDGECGPKTWQAMHNWADGLKI